jgi:hypothetical protein
MHDKINPVGNGMSQRLRGMRKRDKLSRATDT